MSETIDDRFLFLAGGPLPFAPPLVNGYETTTLQPTGNPSVYEWGKQYTWNLENRPHFFGTANCLSFDVKFKRKKLNDPNADWIDCVGDDSKYICLNQLWAHSFVQADAWRSGLYEMKTDGFQSSRGRLIHEILATALADEKSKATFSRVPFDTPILASIDKLAFTPADANYKEWMNKQLPKTFTVYYCPQRPPFRYRHFSTQKDKAFPNIGEPTTYEIQLVNDPKETFYLAKYNNASSAYTYSFDISKIEMNMLTPRVTSRGMDKLSNRAFPPLRYEADYPVQYVVQIEDNIPEKVITLANVPLPEYMLLVLVKNAVFNRFSIKENENLARELTEFQPMNIADVKLTYGGKELNYNTCNFNISDKKSLFLRDKILKNSDIFGCPSHVKNFFLTDEKSRENFRQKHLLFSFCANEETGEKLDVVDANVPKNTPRPLAIHLKAPMAGDLGEDNRPPPQTNLSPGKLIIELIYKNQDILYDMKRGVVLEKDIKSLISAV